MNELPDSEFRSVIQRTQSILRENTEWRERYAGYAKSILRNRDSIKGKRSSFRQWSPLKVYMTISSAKAATNAIRFELRYLGQTVADLKAGKDNGLRLSTKGYERANLCNFGCDKRLSGLDWKLAKEFRSHFKDRKEPRNDTGKHNDEHRLESLLLTEFSKHGNKMVRNIKPVMIGNVRFPMRTPIKASYHEAITYPGKGMGGGIDILARTGIGGRARLCIMELKDENDKREPAKKVIKQAIAYATFIRELLRTDSGSDWWRVFGFRRELPESLELYVACVMPSRQNNDESFGDHRLDVDGDTIRLHYLYFDGDSFKNHNELKINPGDTSLAIIK